MAHSKQKKFCNEVKKKYPEYFEKTYVLDIGSLDVNGNNRYLFDDCFYTGLDVIEGRNVDVVSIAHKYEPPDPPKLFNVIISTNALEHDMYFKLTLKKMIDITSSEGLIFFSAGYSYKIHGTIDTTPEDSGTSMMKGKWASYYKNVRVDDILNAWNVEKLFREFSISVEGKDIRFVGVKK